MGNKKSTFKESSYNYDIDNRNKKEKASFASKPEERRQRENNNAVPVKVWHAFLSTGNVFDVNSEIGVLEARIKRDVDKVLAALKTCNFKRFCIVLKSDPFIQNWRIFEEAVANDTVFCKINAKGELAQDHQSFTLRLIDQGYKITKRELDLIEMRLNGYSKFVFRALKNHIIDHHFIGMMTLQKLCRRSLKRAYRERDYIRCVQSLNYPKPLKDFLLQGS